MSRIQFSGTGQLRFLPAVANTAAPTTTEIAAGTNVTAWLRQDGLKRSVVGSMVAVENAAEAFNSSDIGPIDCALWATFYRDSVSGSDVAWNVLVKGTYGYFIVAPFGFSGAGVGTSRAPADGDRCEVWPVGIATRSPDDVGKDSAQLFTIVTAVTEPPNLSAVVDGAPGLFPSTLLFPSESLFPIGA